MKKLLPIIVMLVLVGLVWFYRDEITRLFQQRNVVPQIPDEEEPEAPRQEVIEAPTVTVGMNDRLPWENNRIRSEVIRALERDIAKIEAMTREQAERIQAVRHAGGKEVYLTSQRIRLSRARNERVRREIQPWMPRAAGIS